MFRNNLCSYFRYYQVILIRGDSEKFLDVNRNIHKTLVNRPSYLICVFIIFLISILEKNKLP